MSIKEAESKRAEQRSNAIKERSKVSNRIARVMKLPDLCLLLPVCEDLGCKAIDAWSRLRLRR